MKFAQDLLKGLSDKEIEEFKLMYNGSRPMLEQIRKVLLEKYNSSRTKQFSKQNYEQASWDRAQADAIGEQRTLLYIINKILPGDEYNG